MAKVVYNACFGGFGLSNEALDRMAELGYKLEPNPDYNPNASDWYNGTQKYRTYVGDIPRHDPILVQVVEELGERANGMCADLRIEEVDNLYRISEYDGSESVEVPENLDWVSAL